MKISSFVEQFRIRAGHYGSDFGESQGMFVIPGPSGMDLRVMASAGDDEVHWEHVSVSVRNEPGFGGACHRYVVSGFDAGTNTSHNASNMEGQFEKVVLFQNGPIQKHGINGLTQEVLLAIIIDRLRGFQSGNFKCRENAIALTHCEDALMWLQKRTRDRMIRGVEGTRIETIEGNECE